MFSPQAGFWDILSKGKKTGKDLIFIESSISGDNLLSICIHQVYSQKPLFSDSWVSMSWLHGVNITHKGTFLFYLLTVPHSFQDLSSPTGDWTQAQDSGSPQSWSLDPQGIPWKPVFSFLLVYSNFIYDSVFVGCTFQGIYPFSLICSICWHVIVS